MNDIVYKNLSIVDIEGEIWRSIEAYPNYMISNYCRVKSLGRKVKCRNGFRVSKDMILKQATSTFGYKQVLLYSGIKKKNMFTHVLVANYFIEKVHGKLYVNHKNGIKHDNRIENLEWCTLKENMRHAIDTGLKVFLNGKDSPLAKKVRSNISGIVYISIREAAQKEGLSRGALKSRLSRNHHTFQYV